MWKLLSAFLILYFPAECPLGRNTNSNKKARSIPIVESNNVQEAVQIFNTHGIGTNEPCQSIKDKSNQIFAQPLCKHAIRKLDPSKTLVGRAKCENVSYKRMSYGRDGQRIPTEERKPMAKCHYGASRFLYIAATPRKEYFYTLESVSNSQVEVRTVFNIEYNQAHEFEKIEKAPTTDPLRADDIFGVYGTRSTVTKTTSSTNRRMGIPKKLCKKAMTSDYMKSISKENATLSNVDCANEHVYRPIFDLKTNADMFAGPYLMTRCWYIHEEEEPNYFLIFNGPFQDTQFIATKSSGSGRVTIQALVKLGSFWG